MQSQTLGNGYLLPRFFYGSEILPPDPDKPTNYAEMCADVRASIEAINGHFQKAKLSYRFACEPEDQAHVVKLYDGDECFPVAKIEAQEGVAELTSLLLPSEDGLDLSDYTDVSDQLAELMGHKLDDVLDGSEVEAWKDYMWELHESFAAEIEDHLGVLADGAAAESDDDPAEDRRPHP